MSRELDKYEPLEIEAIARSQHPEYLEALIALMRSGQMLPEEERNGLRNALAIWEDRTKVAIFAEANMADYNRQLGNIRQGGFDMGIFGPTNQETSNAAREAIAAIFVAGYAIGDPFYIDTFLPYLTDLVKIKDQNKPCINPDLRRQQGGINQLLIFITGVATQGATLARDKQ